MAKKNVEEATAPEVSEVVKVRLLKDHTHAGKDYKVGEVIDIEKRHLEFLEAAGVIGKKEE